MSVSVDTVYQKVLAMANKEQRGYITPQEFNLLADKAQMEIYNGYFHDFKTVDLKPKTNISYGDEMEMLQEKLHPFIASQTISVPSGQTYFNLTTSIYRIKNVTCDNLPIVEMSTDEIIYSENNPLTKATHKRRVFERGISDSKFNIYPTPITDIEITLNYYKTPTKPNWNYVVVQGSALYNSTGSVDFSLHKSEEEILVAKILALSGVVIMKPDVVQYGGGMEAAIKQSQND
tara:strand:+ start:232 stop:930 length:699 start_codon:yes stop_codon:yes gene_type:complete